MACSGTNYVCMYVCMCVCVYIYVCIYIFKLLDVILLTHRQKHKSVKVGLYTTAKFNFMVEKCKPNVKFQNACVQRVLSYVLETSCLCVKSPQNQCTILCYWNYKWELLMQKQENSKICNFLCVGLLRLIKDMQWFNLHFAQLHPLCACSCMFMCVNPMSFVYVHVCACMCLCACWCMDGWTLFILLCTICLFKSI